MRIPRLSLSAPDLGPQLRKALEGPGWVFVRDAPLSAARIERALAAAKAVFALDAEAKAAAARPTGHSRGWYRYVGAGRDEDWIEALALGPDDGSDAAERRRPYFEGVEWPWDVPGTGDRNRWPAGPPELRAELAGYFAACEATAGALLDALGPGLREWHARGDHTLELKQYPATADPPAAPFRVAPHTDLSSLTLLTQDAVGGLQVCCRETGEYFDAPARSDQILVNTGDLLRARLGLPPTLHRVAAVPGAPPRISLVFFAVPDYDAPLGEEEAAGEQVGDVMPAEF